MMRTLPIMRFADRQYLKGVAITLLAMLLWSLSGIFVRLVPGADIWQIAGFRAGSTAVSLLLFLAFLYGRELPRRFRAMAPGALLASAGFFAVGSPLYVTALSFSSVANVACIGATAPIFAAVLAHLFAQERAGWIAWAASIMGVLGVLVIFRADLGTGSEIGNLMALTVAFTFAAQTVILRRFRAVDMVPAICLGAFATFVGIALMRGFDPPPARDLALILVMGVVQLAVPLVLFTRGARTVPAVQLALLGLLDVVLNPLWAWIGVGERPGANAFLGGAVIVGAVAMTVLWTGRARPRPG